VSFVEVKYRRRNTWGQGLEYITVSKQQQMAFAAEFWIASHDWAGTMYLAALEVMGSDFTVTAFVPELA
jgi:Holliday junction resolvase-like predicted endonuclease